MSSIIQIWIRNNRKPCFLSKQIGTSARKTFRIMFTRIIQFVTLILIEQSNLFDANLIHNTIFRTFHCCGLKLDANSFNELEYLKSTNPFFLNSMQIYCYFMQNECVKWKFQLKKCRLSISNYFLHTADKYWIESNKRKAAYHKYLVARAFIHIWVS